MTLRSELHVRTTQRFIDENPTDVTLIRTTRVSDGAGGTEPGADVELPTQTMRLVGLNLRSATEARVSAEGQTVVPTNALIALPSADMANGDVFEKDGVKYEILFISDNPEWRRQAEVFRHAQ